MARGVRTNATLLPVYSPNLQPQSVSSYDPKTRRNTILIAEIVPTLDLSEDNDAAAVFVPSDRYYVKCGAWDGASRVPPWLQNVAGITYQTWDATAEQYYLTHAGGAELYSNIAYLIYPKGHMGAATIHAPKNSNASAVWLKFYAAFTTNGDYGTDGIGGFDSASDFSTASNRFIQVTRNSANWELGTCNGTTISQSASSGGADGSAHAFWVRWAVGEIKLYVDEVLVITKTTHLPDKPLRPAPLEVSGGTNLVRLYDYLIEWEAS